MASDFQQLAASADKNFRRVPDPFTLSRAKLIGAATASVVAGVLGSTMANGQSTPLTIGGMMIEDIAPVIYAQQAQMFKKYGLDVLYEPSASGSAMIGAVVSGTYAIAKSSLMAGAAAIIKGIPLVVIAPGWVFDSSIHSAELIVAEDSPIRTGRDCNGKTIGVVELQGLVQIAAASWVDKNGGDSTSVKFLEMPVGAAAEAVASKRIDATVLLEPVLSASLADGRVRSLGSAFAAVANSFLVSAWFAQRQWVDGNRDTVRRFAHALSDAATYINAHTDETNVILANVAKMPLSSLQRMTHVHMGTTLNAALLQPVLDAAVHYHAISRRVLAREMMTNIS
jgi:NitT/TauT family transport system substrate-binding protein